MNTIYADEDIKYTGAELSPHWIYKNFKQGGDSICAFKGECEVKLSEMVDIEDVLANEPIYSKKMLHFIIEHFELPLSAAILRQRLFMAIIKEVLEAHGHNVIRNGDDLFFEGRKLTVSIAAKSLVSSLIHTGINIEKVGAPIEVSCLNEMGISVEQFARDIMERYKKELEGVQSALCKVRGV